jgi:hypothetical protein
MNAASRVMVTFQSDLFNRTEQRDYFVNPDCFGDDFCKFMVAELIKMDISCEGEPWGEDWGWMFRLEFEGRKFDVGASYHPDGFWLAFVEPWNGVLKQLFGGGKKDIPLELTRKIHAILCKTEGIEKVRWHKRKDFDSGNDEAGTSEPD